MDRKCRKCGSKIPYRVCVEGKIASLQNRKFCLTCSPYKGHNTKSDDPAREAKTVNEYAFWSPSKKKRHQARTSLRGLLLRERAIEAAGGKCIRCGYDKCLRNMQFHHRDPALKLFAISAVNIRIRQWEEIVTEIQKCDLLCSNCHGEEEDRLARDRFIYSHPEFSKEISGLTKWSDVLATVGKSTKGKRIEHQVVCAFCGKQFTTKSQQEFCSSFCFGEARRKTPIPPKEEIQKARANGLSWSQIGMRYGVKRSTVKKWLEKYGLTFPPLHSKIGLVPCAQCGQSYKPIDRSQKFCSLECHGLASRKVVQPSYEDLVEMRKTQTLMQIGSRYGVNWCTVRDWIKRYESRIENGSVAQTVEQRTSTIGVPEEESSEQNPSNSANAKPDMGMPTPNQA